MKTGISRGGFTETDEFSWNRTFPSSAVFARRALWGPFSIQPEAIQVRRIGVSEIGGSTLTLVADYVELPVMVQARLLAAKGIAPFLSAGPSVNLRLRCRLQFVGGGLVTDDDCEAAGGEPSSGVDFGISGGGGLNVTAGPMTLQAEIRATTGLKKHVLPVAIKPSRNTGLSALVGISMPLQRGRFAPPARPPLLAVRPPERITPDEMVPAPTLSEPREVRAAPETRRISVTATDVDVRELLAGIAQATGLNIVVSSQIRQRVSLTLDRVPASVAVQAIVDVAGLSLSRPAAPGQGTIVFSQAAVNVNDASSERIAARFGVSAELAKWIVESRTPDVKRP